MRCKVITKFWKRCVDFFNMAFLCIYLPPERYVPIKTKGDECCN